MKSEHRHELAENDLSKLLGRWMEKFDEHANKLLIAIVGAALIAAAFIFLTRTWANQRANGWTELAASTSPEQYETVADAFSGSVVGDWARLRAANGFLQEGIRASLSDRAASNDRMEQARAAFESLTASGTHPAVREQAFLGLAVSLESQSNGDTEPAIAAYQNLLDEFPSTRFKDWATERMDALKTGSVQEFYAWFHKQDPKPADMPLPKDQGGPSNDSLDSILNNLGDSGVPNNNGGGTPFGNMPFEIPLSGGSGESKSADEDIDPFADPSDANTDSEKAVDDNPEPATDEETTPDADVDTKDADASTEDADTNTKDADAGTQDTDTSTDADSKDADASTEGADTSTGNSDNEQPQPE